MHLESYGRFSQTQLHNLEKVIERTLQFRLCCMVMQVRKSSRLEFVRYLFFPWNLLNSVVDIVVNPTVKCIDIFLRL